jgi:hypothetical protein
MESPVPFAAAAAKIKEGEIKMPTYRVVIEGNALPGFAQDDVLRELAGLIRRPAEVAEKLLSGSPRNVKTGLDEPTSRQYVESLRKIGVACHVEEETLDFDINEAPAKRAGVKPTTSGASTQEPPVEAPPLRKQEVQATATALPSKQGAVVGGWVSLGIGALLMVWSLLSFILYLPLFFASFVLGIVAIAQRRLGHGIAILLLSVVLPLFLGIGLGAQRFHDAMQEAKSSVSSNSSDLASLSSKSTYQRQSNSCSPSDFSLEKLSARNEQFAIYFVGQLVNNCNLAAGAQIKFTLYDKSGNIVHVHDGWVASTSNIPAHSTYPFQTMVMREQAPGFDHYTAQVSEVRSWR